LDAYTLDLRSTSFAALLLHAGSNPIDSCLRTFESISQPSVEAVLSKKYTGLGFAYR